MRSRNMPYFRFFDRDKLERLLDTLGSRFALFTAVPTPAQPAGEQAKRLWDTTCATCHGPDGGVSAFGRTLLPAPPDLRHFSLTPQRALAVITDGYPGTVMSVMAKRSRDSKRKASGPSLATVTESEAASNSSRATCWLISLSSTSNTRAPRTAIGNDVSGVGQRDVSAKPGT